MDRINDAVFPTDGPWPEAELQWRDLVAELREQLPERLAQELVVRAQSQAQQVTQSFVGPLTQRIQRVEQTRGHRIELGRPHSRQSALQALRTRLTLMNPADVARELAPGLQPPDLNYYNQVVEDLARLLPHPTIARRYALPAQGLSALADQVAWAGRPVVAALEEHGRNLMAYADQVAAQRAQPLVQKGARILGNVVASALEPLVGRGAVTQVLGLENAATDQLEQVELGWNAFRRELSLFQEERQRRHQLLCLSLLAGLFLGVRRDLLHLGCELFMDQQGRFHLEPTAERQELVRRLFQEGEPAVRSALQSEKPNEAERLASALLHQVATDPIAARTGYQGRAIGYWAYALHLSALLARAHERWGAGQPEAATALWQQIFAEYPCPVADADLVAPTGEEQPLVLAGYRLSAYAEWLRESNRPADADRLLRIQVDYVNRHRSSGVLSRELVEWAGALATYLRQEPRQRGAAPVPDQTCPAGRYPVVVRQFHQAVGGELARSPLDQYLRRRASLVKGAAVAAATGGLSVLGTLIWWLLL